MIRNLKILGLALAAVFAFAAVTASGAMAQQGHLTSDGPVTLTSEEIVEGSEFLEAFGIKVKCPGTTYTGHKINVTPHEFIPNGATEVTITPHYPPTTAGGAINCTAAGFPATINMTSCDYDAILGETTGTGTDTYGVEFKVTCEPGDHIDVTVYTTEAEDPSTPFCHLTVGQEGNEHLVGAHATDETNGHIKLTETVTGISATRTNHGAHALLCANNTSTTTAKFFVNSTLFGHNEAGGSTNIGLSHS